MMNLLITLKKALLVNNNLMLRFLSCGKVVQIDSKTCLALFIRYDRFIKLISTSWDS
jgi:hypothetical protein